MAKSKKPGVRSRKKPSKRRPFHADVRAQVKRNTFFRRVLFTGPNLQIVAMALKPGEDIGKERHPVDQCFFFVQGKGRAVVASKTIPIGDDSLCVPANTWHNIINTGKGPLKLFTVYAPPQHPAGTVHRTKAEAERSEKHENFPDTQLARKLARGEV